MLVGFGRLRRSAPWRRASARAAPSRAHRRGVGAPCGRGFRPSPRSAGRRACRPRGLAPAARARPGLRATRRCRTRSRESPRRPRPPRSTASRRWGAGAGSGRCQVVARALHELVQAPRRARSRATRRWRHRLRSRGAVREGRRGSPRARRVPRSHAGAGAAPARTPARASSSTRRGARRPASGADNRRKELKLYRTQPEFPRCRICRRSTSGRFDRMCGPDKQERIHR